MTSRDAHREATRAKIARTAERLFRERGYKATTIRDIAAAAGVSVGSVMTLGDKRALLVAMFDRYIAEVHQERARQNQSTTPGGAGTSTADSLIELVRPFLEIFSTQSDLAREYAAALVSGAHSSVIFKDLEAALITEIESALAKEGMPPASVPGAARTIYLSYLGSLFEWAGGSGADISKPLRNLRLVLNFVTESKEA
ncbi:hypothetical protein GCM10010116_56360 [Microbispora rosea subsp. aerata]|nr:TetR/AcrR family transcriptional regulator [Microbispora rosea]GGO28108.1 hypothetical protein GCM10010116_56360 [Microbispora rosea subsp. aerata]GIH56183.1 hypothetical protein Mro02_30970 [Microbispora rosea subsp. aerata]GLJ85748.1 hypothetical protein GCM10017588_44810 [Microbispora rosea subsp. aerata]